MSTQDFKFGRQYMLKSQKTIEQIFSEGFTVKSFPFVAKVCVTELNDDVPFKWVFSAPKKKFRHAHQRNRIKRICREAVRLNKRPLEDYLHAANKQIAIFLIFTAQEELNHELLSKKMQELIHKLIHQLDEHSR